MSILALPLIEMTLTSSSSLFHSASAVFIMSDPVLRFLVSLRLPLVAMQTDFFHACGVDNVLEFSQHCHNK
jgi:hypothetical protein